ncbi:Asp-tRNA(Asn)/Glu-tRNA(Gln) amidotransferase subunit GatB [Paracrocinitomix mangrovi]|uniref:Asp-tRNA(Asn)/Glu-tRNA(Gln) amidotransferase subunit GatB n=1 Tax=Paracrocinitomix mangrovi TaxID=2862509 RepID=UPI001EDAB3EB|nr:Asp-tRNA(Asn)/Glu-tRNA(Gln) amidotransferase subunit GatB [Paracrocinitomix mangrovi]UKN02137.1 Asp-tRNA(Asn)/Glu-tRNA(Gln) amidotransferase subunit GatB [Paracrocinitomix mangrovi]
MELSKEIRDKYKAVIGLEVHAQMLTKSKAYSDDINEYGSAPNTNVSVITLGHPGTLPKMNKKTIDYAIKMGIACGCDIAEEQHFARKNYFYPDLPKGYQITQDTTPICTGGSVLIKDESGNEKLIGLTRIHMEEDAGKSIHDIDPFNTLIDLNRAGVPLIEIVSEPDIESSQEAYNYLTEVRKLVRYLDICDGNMEEGSLRCDANVSVMLKDATEFGTKVEVKNMNSIRNVQRAIEFEISRQIAAVEAGEKVYQETRNFNALSGETTAMRTKEAAMDYRYFPEPDLQPIKVTQEHVDSIAAEMPPLPNALFKKYTKELGLSDYDAQILTDLKEIALYFEDIIEHTNNYKAAANWLMGDVKSYLNEKAISIKEFPISAERIADLIKLIDSGKVSNNLASQKLFPAMLTEEGTAEDIASKNDWIQDSNEDSIKDMIRAVFQENPSEYERFKAGEKKLMGFLMGQLMKKSQGKADPKSASKLINELVDE